MSARWEAGAIRAVALDFDGVIVDSMPAQELAWMSAVERLARAGERDDVRARLRRNLYAGRAGEAMFEGVAVDDHEQRILRAAKDEIWADEQGKVLLKEGAARAIPRLAARYPLAIATTASRDYVEEVLDRERLRGCFEVVLTDADVPQPKPAPDLLLEISRRLKVPAKRLLMVGDTTSDAAMAERAGCPMILFSSRLTPDPLPANAALSDGWPDLLERLLPRRELQPAER